jgi:hypothetical protein
MAAMAWAFPEEAEIQELATGFEESHAQQILRRMESSAPLGQ